MGSKEDNPSVTSGELRLAAMDLLARREHGFQELLVKLRQRFRRRTCSDEQVLDVLTALIDEDLLSDERFALSTVRQLVNRGYGPRRIAETFRQQGIEDYLSGALAAAFDTPIDWHAEAASAYQKKYRGDCLVKTIEEGPFNLSKLDCHDIAVSVTSAGLQTLMPGIILKDVNCSTA